MSLENIDWNGLAEQATPYLTNLVAAIAVFVIGRIVVKWVAKLIGNAARKKLDDTIGSFIETLIGVVLLAVVIIAALSVLGVDMTAAAAILGGMALAVGLSLQGQLSSLASGIMLAVTRPFKVGHFVEAGGTAGVVENIGILATTLKSGNNQTIIVPNSNVWSGTITNYSDRPTRRIDLTVGVSYDADLRQARQVLEAVIAAEERILKDPAPLVAVKELGASSVDFVVRPWVKNADYWDVLFAITEAVKLKLDDAEIGIPYPQMDVHLHKAGE